MFNCKSSNLVPRACDPWEGNEGSGIIRCRKPGILAKIELRIHFNGQSDSSLKRIIPEPSFPSQGSQARGTRLQELLFWHDNFLFCKVDGLHYEINSYHDPLGKYTHACLFKNGLEAVLLPTLILYR